MTPAWIDFGRAHDLVQHAVDAEPDPQVVLGRLDVDVGRAVLHRLGDQQVDELDDRRVLDDLVDAARGRSSSACSSAAACDHRVDVGVEAVEAVDRVDDLATRSRRRS